MMNNYFLKLGWKSSLIKMNCILVLLFFGLASANAQNAQKTIQGKILDQEGIPLPGATVLVQDTENGTLSDFDGNYTIQASTGDVLVVSFLGYKTQNITVETSTTINITLQEDSSMLKEVVIVSYGTQKAAEITGSISTVKASEMRDIPVGQITQTVQGKVSGVQISQTSGTPGRGLTVRIRGAASVSAGNSPLFVVDGFPINGDLSAINPKDVESISILKDAASSALYGSRAANGVVLITTKSAKMGKSSFNVDSYVGIQSVPKKGRPDMMNAREFAQFRKEVAIENGVAVDPAYQNPEQYGEGTDWYDVLLQDGIIQEHNVSFSSRNEKAGLTVSAGIFDQEGVLLNTGFNRFSLRINTDFKISDKVKVGFNIAPNVVTANNYNTEGSLWGHGVLQSAVLTSPLAVHINPDGTIPLRAEGAGLFPNPNWYNILLNSQDARAENLDLFSNNYIQVELLEGLKYKGSIGFELKRSNSSYWRNSQYGGIFSPPPSTIYSSKNYSKADSWLTEHVLNYTKSFGNHNIDVLGGFSAQEYKYESLSGSASNYPDELIRDFSAAPRDNRNTDDSLSEWSLVSYFGRMNYNYNGKYFASASYRRDGSSRFGTDRRYGSFPSFSAGWILSKEDFFPENSFISFAKLRGSWGKVGNNSIGNYTHRALVGTSNTIFGNNSVSGRTASSIGNSLLSWEQTKELDLGTDLSFLDDKITFEYSYYKKNTEQLLFNVPIPRASGFGSILTNLGEIEFWGHEFSVGAQIIDKEDFKLNLNVNYTNSDNKVISLDTGDRELISYAHITSIGERLGQYYGLDHIGVYVDQADYDNGPTPHQPSVVGSEKFRDVDGDGVVERGDDRTVLGSPIPTSFYGFTLNMEYKNFDFSVIGSGAAGHLIADGFEGSTGNLDGVFNVNRGVLNRWRSPSDPGDGHYGGTIQGTTGPGRDWFNDRILYKGDYLTIKNISLGYTLPKLKGDWINSVRFYTSVQQAFVFTNYKGANPEVSGGGSPLYQGFDNTAYPVARTVTFGVNLKF